jgi:hypothetical protein
VHSDANLQKALVAMLLLAHMRDQDRVMSPIEIALSLKIAAQNLCKVLGLTIPDRLPSVRDCRDPEAMSQEWRHFGRHFE